MGWGIKQPSLSIQPSPGFDHFIHGLHGATNPCLIKGVIHLTVTHELRSPRVLVRFTGKTKTGWLGNVDTRSNTVAAMAVWWTGPLNRISSDSHSEKRKLIDEKQIVFKDDDAYYGDALPTYDQARALTDQAPMIQNGTLQPGTYNLPFMFRVPGILPPSFQWKDGHISYYLQATVEYKEGFFGKLTRKKQTARVPLILDRYNLEHIVVPKSGVPPAPGSARRLSMGNIGRSSGDTRRGSISFPPRTSMETTFSLGSATTVNALSTSPVMPPMPTNPAVQPSRTSQRPRLSFSAIPGTPNPELLSPPPMSPPIPPPRNHSDSALSTSSSSESTLLATDEVDDEQPPQLIVPARPPSPAASITQVAFNPIPFSPLPLVRSTTNTSQVHFTFSEVPLIHTISSAPVLDPFDLSTDCVVISNLHDTSPHHLRYRVSLPSRSFGPDDPVIAHVHVASIPSGCSIKYASVSIKAEIEVRAQGSVKRTRTTITEHRDIPQHAGDYWKKTIRFHHHHKVDKPTPDYNSLTTDIGPSRCSFVSPLITVKHSLKIRFALEGAIPRSSRYVGMEVPIVLHVADEEAKKFLRDNEGEQVDGVMVNPLPQGGTVVSRALEYDPFTRREGFAEAGGRFSIGLPLSRSVTW